MFDAAVSVSITPTGITGQLYDLKASTVSPLASDQISVGYDHVTVLVSPGQQSNPNGRPVHVVFAPSNTAFATASASNFESFAPEFKGFVVSPHPIPHHNGT